MTAPHSSLRIFVAGASGVIGRRLLPLLLADGHTVAAMTRHPDQAERLAAMGAIPVVCDVYDSGALVEHVGEFGPDAVVHQLTDLPDDVSEVRAAAGRNDRMRTVGTGNLVRAATAAGSRHLLVQSIAWRPAGRTDIIDRHEQLALDAGGVVVRYGQLYGPDTYYEAQPPPEPRIHVDRAATDTVPLITAPSGIVTLVESAVSGAVGDE